MLVITTCLIPKHISSTWTVFTVQQWSGAGGDTFLSPGCVVFERLTVEAEPYKRVHLCHLKEKIAEIIHKVPFYWNASIGIVQKHMKLSQRFVINQSWLQLKIKLLLEQNSVRNDRKSYHSVWPSIIISPTPNALLCTAKGSKWCEWEIRPIQLLHFSLLHEQALQIKSIIDKSVCSMFRNCQSSVTIIFYKHVLQSPQILTDELLCKWWLTQWNNDQMF